MKKTIILKESELIELIESTVTDIQEQGMAGGMAGNDYRANPQNAGSSYDGPGPCDIYKRDAKAMARKIVALDFEGWTVADTEFYEKYANESGCGFGIGLFGKTMNEWIAWVAEGEPGMCDKWWHCVLPVFEIAALFIPVVGIFVSMGIGMVDAALYYNEGDKQTAGLVGFLTLLPVVGKVVKKFPFVKQWGKSGGKKIALKIANEQPLSMLERYQLKALGESTEFLEREVTKHVQEAITQKMAREGIEKYTLKQQAFLKQFAVVTTVFVGAGLAYNEIYDKVAETGVLGPQDLIRKRWGIEPRDKPVQNIVNAFFMKMLDPEADISYINNTYWDSIKTLFHSDSSGTDGELMVQAIKHGWNPLQIEGKGNYTVVPKKYRTEGYNKWVNETLNNKVLKELFMSDGSEKDNNLLLEFIVLSPDWTPSTGIPEEYQTEAYKKYASEETEEEDFDYLDNFDFDALE